MARRDWRGIPVKDDTSTNQTKWSGEFTEAERAASEFRREQKTLSHKVIPSSEHQEVSKIDDVDEFGRYRPASQNTAKSRSPRHRLDRRSRSRSREDRRATHKRSSRSRSSVRNRSRSRGRRVDAEIPADPRRPDLDEERGLRKGRKQKQRGTKSSRNRSRSTSPQRRRMPYYSQRRERDDYDYHRRRQDNARETSSWTHDLFDDRSPSPEQRQRQRYINRDPHYKPAAESWSSRAGGVYVPNRTQQCEDSDNE